MTARRQASEQDWLDKVIVRGPSGELELTSRGWWQRVIPGNNFEQCRRAVDSYLNTEGAQLNATSLAHLSANVMNLNAVLSAAPAGSSLQPLAHPVTRAGGRIKVQVEALARELTLLTMDRDALPTRSFTIDLGDVKKSLVATYIRRHEALSHEETASLLLTYGEVMRIMHVAVRLLSAAPYDRDVARSVVNLQRALSRQHALLEEAVGTMHVRLDEIEQFDNVLHKLDRGETIEKGFTLPRAKQVCNTSLDGVELAALMSWRARAVGTIDHVHRFLTGVFASNPGGTPRRVPGDPLPAQYPHGMQQCIKEGQEAAKAYIKRGRRS